MEKATAYNLSIEQERFRKKMLNPLLFGFYTLFNVPAGWLAGMKLKSLDQHHAVSVLPFRWLNKNPFKSIYFAVQSMAAELSTASIALLAVQGQRPGVALIIVDLKASFPKKAVGKTTFRCEDGALIFNAVEEAIATGEPKQVTARTTGRLADGTVVAEFYFTWSFKQRSK